MQSDGHKRIALIQAHQLFTPVGDFGERMVVMEIDWHIGDVIQKLRRKKRWNQTQLAERVGVNKATIVRAEDGDPKVSRETYLKIANALGATIAELEMAVPQETQRPAAEPTGTAGSRFSEDRRRINTGPPPGLPERRKA